MIFKSAVKCDGIRYEAGTKVPADFDESIVEKLISDGVIGEKTSPVVEDAPETPEDDGTEKPSTRMKKEELIALAEAKGIQVEETMSKSDIVALLSE